jgi:type IV pilus assembly protein PilB
MITGIVKSLVARGIIDENKALALVDSSQSKRLSIVQAIMLEKFMAASDLATIISQEYGIPYLELDAFDLTQVPKVAIKSEEVSHGLVLPLFKRGGTIFIALADPANLHVLDIIKFQTGSHPEPIIVAEDKLHVLAQNLSSKADLGSLDEMENSFLESLDISSGDDNSFQAPSKDDAPVVRFVNKILIDAINVNASDVHFEPYEKVFRIRFRQDGILREHANSPTNMSSRVATRIKVMSMLDIAERRMPQDGRFKMRLSPTRNIDFRVSTCPTMHGEKVVMRILDPSSSQVGIDALGYEDFQKEIVLRNIKKPQGMVLATGPTGSGKTISLYTALQILNTVECNISTAEDPIEINLPGVNQVNLNSKAGLEFATILRAFLRQDPDIIMVGEIRDLETAEIAIKAAQTGHMVLSTLHTNSAAETLTRLHSMGIPIFNIATSISLVVAQRLARKLCEKCKVVSSVPNEALLEAGFAAEEVTSGSLKIYQATGCSNCHEGYKGRTGIFEVMEITKDIGKIIMAGGSSIDIEDSALKAGMWTLRRAGLEKVKRGILSLEEVNRVTQE